MSSAASLEIFDDKEVLASTVAERFYAALAERLAEPGDVHVALTGGTMGIATLTAIAASPDREALPWERVHFWWGDERYVPKGDPERNDEQAHEALLKYLDLPGGTVHPFPTSDQQPDQELAAHQYAEELARYAPDDGAWPRFDITFLGIGPDGHIASLFPGFPQVEVTDRSVVAVQDSPKPPPYRLSLTMPVINSSDVIWFVVAGEDKATALRRALDGVDPMLAPVAGAAGRESTVFFADRAAASEIDRG